MPVAAVWAPRVRPVIVVATGATARAVSLFGATCRRPGRTALVVQPRVREHVERHEREHQRGRAERGRQVHRPHGLRVEEQRRDHSLRTGAVTVRARRRRRHPAGPPNGRRGESSRFTVSAYFRAVRFVTVDVCT